MSYHSNLVLPALQTEKEQQTQTQNGSESSVWRFKGSDTAAKASSVTMRVIVYKLFDLCTPDVKKTLLPLAHGDPSVYPCFRTSIHAENAIIDVLRSGKGNSYGPAAGILPARQAVADYVNRDLANKVTPNDIFMTVGCNQGIEVVIQSLARPNANILLPRPSYPHYEARSVYSGLEVRKYDLLPENEWEIDLQGIEAMADENTVAMAIINPNNPCGNVYSHDHLKKVAETARRLGIMVISDEVYCQTIFGDNPFVPMGKFSTIAPVITLGGISKGWVVPGWRIGWIALNDPQCILKSTGVVQSIQQNLDITPDPTTMVQMALPEILGKANKEMFAKKNLILKQNVELVCDRLKAIPCVVVTKKPESCTYLLTKLELPLMEDIEDDMDFSMKLAKEENLVLLPGVALGLKNWIRITIGVEAQMLEDALERLNVAGNSFLPTKASSEYSSIKSLRFPSFYHLRFQTYINGFYASVPTLEFTSQLSIWFYKKNHTPYPSPVSLSSPSSPKKNPKGGQNGLLASASPRRSSVETKVVNQGTPKHKKSARSKHTWVSSCPSSHLISDLERIGESINDLIMWRDVAKSTLCFGLGCISFLSSCFAKGVHFSVFSAISYLGLFFLGLSFLSNTLRPRGMEEATRKELKLSEGDVLRVARRMLPITNLAISKTSELFSGEPAMTLKVAPFVIIGSDLITLWRLCAFGFFLSFTVPKLYSCYATQINRKVESAQKRIVEAWGICTHKKIVAGSIVTAFWNLTSLKTRFFTVFITVVAIRYRRQGRI
ncbi:hypothetical protein AALP_AA7G125100 [Arabis alpina]|uniref:Reticulon-like protein n=1 Tax=Arabis alpina TaxID=50452 RepID=A0A087GHL7_ARAAL|nr:hypothetical protein AALP_AA7G125100 [Arabis alpina]